MLLMREGKAHREMRNDLPIEPVQLFIYEFDD